MNRILLTLFGMLLAWGAGDLNQAVLAATYYVRVTGDDTNNGLSPAAAFKTISKADSVVVSGDTVYVGAGTYDKDVFIDTVTGLYPLRFIADTLGTQTGDSGAVVFQAGKYLKVQNSDNVEIQGFTFNGDDRSIQWNNSTNGLIQDCIVNGGTEGIEVNSGDVVIDGAQVQNCSDEGIDINDGTVTVQNSTLSLNAIGLECGNATVTIDGTTISSNAIGLYSLATDSLTVSNTTITGSSTWGVNFYDSTSPSATATFSNCSISNNAGGIAITDAEDGDVTLTAATVINNNTQTGLHFDTCSLTVNDQAGGTNWSVSSNAIGISCYNSTVSFVNITVSNSTQYSIHCDQSTATVTGCTLSGQGGVFATSSNNSLTMSTTRLDASATGGWGLSRHGGDVDVKNTVFCGFDNGIYLATANSLDTAVIANTTIANITAEGIKLQTGSADVRNTILAGSSATNGLTDNSSQMIHVNNLLFGFTTPFNNTLQAASEIVKNPRFVDAVNGDVHLATGSPAINNGQTIGGLTTDIDSNARPLFTVFDIGAYEYTSDAGSFRVLNWNETE